MVAAVTGEEVALFTSQKDKTVSNATHAFIIMHGKIRNGGQVSILNRSTKLRLTLHIPLNLTVLDGDERGGQKCCQSWCQQR